MKVIDGLVLAQLNFYLAPFAIPSVISKDSINVNKVLSGLGAKKRMIAPNGARIPVQLEKASSSSGPIACKKEKTNINPITNATMFCAMSKIKLQLNIFIILDDYVFNLYIQYVKTVHYRNTEFQQLNQNIKNPTIFLNDIFQSLVV